MSRFQKLSDQIQESFLKTAANIYLYCDGEEQKATMEELRGIVEKNVAINAKLNEAEKVFEEMTELHNLNDEGKSSVDVPEAYKKKLAEINPDISKNKNLMEFNRQVKELLKVSENDLENNDTDDDVQFTQNTVSVIDPFTKQRMSDPVRNKICGHNYDRQSVNDILKVNPKTRCPVVGCGNKKYIILDHLETDIILKTRLLKKAL